MPDLFGTRLLATQQCAHFADQPLGRFELALLHLARLLGLDQSLAVIGKLCSQFLHTRLQVGQSLRQIADLLLACQHARARIGTTLHAEPATADPQAIRGDETLTCGEGVAASQGISEILGNEHRIENMGQHTGAFDE
ncbi:MAG: hypothetical protein KDI67_14050, partial [Gammaproteobacteria bacterium]|nr:hypothetical protein [Gammaproteobacteria bacterium]